MYTPPSDIRLFHHVIYIMYKKHKIQAKIKPIKIDLVKLYCGM